MFPKILLSDKSWLPFPFLWNSQFCLLRLTWGAYSDQSFETTTTDDKSTVPLQEERRNFITLNTYTTESQHSQRIFGSRFPLGLKVRETCSIPLNGNQTNGRDAPILNLRILQSSVVTCFQSKRVVALYVIEIIETSALVRYCLLEVSVCPSGKIRFGQHKLWEEEAQQQNSRQAWKVVLGNGPLVAACRNEHWKVYKLEDAREFSDCSILYEGVISVDLPQLCNPKLIPLFIDSNILLCSCVSDEADTTIALFYPQFKESYTGQRLLQVLSAPVVAVCSRSESSHNNVYVFVTKHKECFEIYIDLQTGTSNSASADISFLGNFLVPCEYLSEETLLLQIPYHGKQYLSLSTFAFRYIEFADLGPSFRSTAKHYFASNEQLAIFFVGDIWVQAIEKVHSNFPWHLWHKCFFLDENVSTEGRKSIHSRLNSTSDAEDQFLTLLQERIQKGESGLGQLQVECRRIIHLLKWSIYKRIHELSDLEFDNVEFLFSPINAVGESEARPILTALSSKEQGYLDTYVQRRRAHIVSEKVVKAHPLGNHQWFPMYQQEGNPTEKEHSYCIALPRKDIIMPILTFYLQNGQCLMSKMDVSSSMLSIQPVSMIRVPSPGGDVVNSSTHSKSVTSDTALYMPKVLYFGDYEKLSLYHLIPTRCSSNLHIIEKLRFEENISLLDAVVQQSIHDSTSWTGSCHQWIVIVFISSFPFAISSFTDLKNFIYQICESAVGLTCIRKDENSGHWFGFLPAWVSVQIIFDSLKNNRFCLKISCSCVDTYRNTLSLLVHHFSFLSDGKITEAYSDSLLRHIDSVIKKMNKEWNYVQNVGLNQVSQKSWSSIIEQTDLQIMYVISSWKWSRIWFISGKRDACRNRNEWHSGQSRGKD